MIDRAIKNAYDNVLSKVVFIDDVASDTKDGFKLREQYNKILNRFSCLGCEQTLVVSYSKRDLIFFKHLPKSGYCIYKDASVGSEIIYGYELTRLSKESDRHIELKTKIGKLLSQDSTGQISNLDIDKKFIFNGNEKRRPDVFCHFGEKKIAFEIQLSPLPLHYINDRFRFYKEKGIYLIWILDVEETPKKLSSHQRDLKYSCPHQNLFKLNELETNQLELIGHYKIPYIAENLYREKWTMRSVQLSDLQFNDDFSCFLFDYLVKVQEVENQLIRINEENRLKRLAEVQNAEALKITNTISKLLRLLKYNIERDFNMYRIIIAVNALNSIEISELNKQMDLNKIYQGAPVFLYYIKMYEEKEKEYKATVIELILGCENFQFNINEKDDSGDGIIQYLYRNTSLEKYNFKLVPFIFLRGYKLTNPDKDFIFCNLKNAEYEYMKLYCYSACINNIEIQFVKQKFAYLRFIKSALRMLRLDSNQNSWVKYMMPIMSNYKEYWKYTEIVLVKTNLGNELKKVDRKRTIERKIIEFNLRDTPQDDSIKRLFVELFPMIFS